MAGRSLIVARHGRSGASPRPTPVRSGRSRRDRGSRRRRVLGCADPTPEHREGRARVGVDGRVGAGLAELDHRAEPRLRQGRPDHVGAGQGGDKVEAGQPLATIDDFPAKQTLAQQQAQLASQQAALAKITSSPIVEGAENTLAQAQQILDARSRRSTPSCRPTTRRSPAPSASSTSTRRRSGPPRPSSPPTTAGRAVRPTTAPTTPTPPTTTHPPAAAHQAACR